MSEDEAKVQSGEEEEEKASPKKGGRGRPKKAAPATPASAEVSHLFSFALYTYFVYCWFPCGFDVANDNVESNLHRNIISVEIEN